MHNLNAQVYVSETPANNAIAAERAVYGPNTQIGATRSTMATDPPCSMSAFDRPFNQGILAEMLAPLAWQSYHRHPTTRCWVVLRTTKVPPVNDSILHGPNETPAETPVQAEHLRPPLTTSSSTTMCLVLVAVANAIAVHGCGAQYIALSWRFSTERSKSKPSF